MNFFATDYSIQSGPKFRSVNPVNNELLAAYPFLSEELLLKQMEQAQESFQEYWKPQTIDERVSLLRLIGKDLEENLEVYARLITQEMGKPITESRAEIRKCKLLCDHFCEAAPAYLADEIINDKSYITKQALGAILGIMPWNFPFWQSFRFAIPAILSGNVVFLKPAPNVPQCALAIESMFVKAIGRSGVFTNLFIKEWQVAALIKHSFVQGVALTGSDRAGEAVGQMAGKALKKCVLELGGADAFIVLADADLEKAAEAAVSSRMKCGGQTCISAKRWILVAEIAEAFTEKVKEKMSAIKIGDPFDPQTELSALARPDLVQNLERQITESIALGAKVILEGGAKEARGNFFSPMIIGAVSPGMPLYEEEVFGPVASLFVVENEAAAIALANDTVYGLGASIWTNDLAKAKKVAVQIEAGAVAINNFVSSHPALPFGGIKRSGFGKELGKAGMLEFVNQKTVVIG